MLTNTNIERGEELIRAEVWAGKVEYRRLRVNTAGARYFIIDRDRYAQPGGLCPWRRTKGEALIVELARTEEAEQTALDRFHEHTRDREAVAYALAMHQRRIEGKKTGDVDAARRFRFEQFKERMEKIRGQLGDLGFEIESAEMEEANAFESLTEEHQTTKRGQLIEATSHLLREARRIIEGAARDLSCAVDALGTATPEAE